jgi:CrcB protein
MRLLLQAVLVSVGSMLGGLLRWGVGVGFGRLFGTRFPWGTFFINITGSLFIGWFTTILAERIVFSEKSWLRADDLRLLIAVGFTGAYTTFSTFEYEANKLIDDGDGFAGLTYIFASLFLGLVAVRAGIALARWK